MKACEKTKVNQFKACEVHESKYNACDYESIPDETYRRKIFMGLTVILNLI